MYASIPAGPTPVLSFTKVLNNWKFNWKLTTVSSLIEKKTGDKKGIMMSGGIN